MQKIAKAGRTITPKATREGSLMRLEFAQPVSVEAAAANSFLMARPFTTMSVLARGTGPRSRGASAPTFGGGPNT
jgi:hypothetical protein